MRFYRRRAAFRPVMLLLGTAALFSLLLARYTSGLHWPYWLIAAACVSSMIAVSAIFDRTSQVDEEAAVRPRDR